MGLRQCDKCSEMVDEAKAFCPGCGHSFVEEEKRQESSEFESSPHTVQFGQTMYNEMLSDMGLNIANKPAAPEKRIEVLTSIKTDDKAPARKEKKKRASGEARPSEEKVFGSGAPSRTKWYILAAVGILILLPIAIASTIFLISVMLSRMGR